jgi:hypothetical protein
MGDNIIKRVVLKEMRKLKTKSDNKDAINREINQLNKIFKKLDDKGVELKLDEWIYNMSEDVIGTGGVELHFFNWLKENKPQQIEDKLKKILETTFHINRCGSYDFEFKPQNYNELTSFKRYIDIKGHILDAENSYVTILNTGEEYTIPDVLQMEEYWEVQYEIADCIKEEINKVLTPYTGMSIDIAEYDY